MVVENIKDIIKKACDKYFNTLKIVGSISTNDMYKLVIASFIQEAIDGNYGRLLTENELKIMLTKLNYLTSSSCVLPYLQYCRDTHVNVEPTYTYVRVTQNNQGRVTENDLIRIL